MQSMAGLASPRKIMHRKPPSYCKTPSDFPRSEKYDQFFCRDQYHSGANPFWLTEWLCSQIPIKPGMRILDVGCGSAKSSVFIVSEFGCVSWALDKYFSVDSNFKLAVDFSVQDKLFPLHGDARCLPFPEKYFDAIVFIDSYQYFGSDGFFPKYIGQFLKPSGYLGLVSAGVKSEFSKKSDLPPHLLEWWTSDHWAMHSCKRWIENIANCDLFDILFDDEMSQGWEKWLKWQKWAYPDNKIEIDAIAADSGSNLCYWRIIAKRNDRSTATSSWNPY